MKTNVWITGVEGFTARYLLGFLRSLDRDFHIVGLGRAAESTVEVDEYLSVDLAKPETLIALDSVADPELIFHLAAVMPPGNVSDFWTVNVGGTSHFFRAISQYPNCRVLLVGSAAEYLNKEEGEFREEDPIGGETLYGQSKSAQNWVANAIAQQFGFHLSIARPFNLIGPGLPDRWVVASLIRQFSMKNPEGIRVGRIDSERDFVDVRDCVRAFWKILTESTVSGETYNVCSGQPTRISSLIEICHDLTDHSCEIKSDESRFRSVDLDCVFGSRQKIYQAFAWEPEISLRSSLIDMFSWEKKHYRLDV